MKSEPNWNFICVVVVSLGIITTLISQLDSVIDNWWVLLIIVPIFIFAMIMLSRMYIASSQYYGQSHRIRYTDEQCRAINEGLVASEDGLRCDYIGENESEPESEEGDVELSGNDEEFED